MALKGIVLYLSCWLKYLHKNRHFFFSSQISTGKDYCRISSIIYSPKRHTYNNLTNVYSASHYNRIQAVRESYGPGACIQKIKVLYNIIFNIQPIKITEIETLYQFLKPYIGSIKWFLSIPHPIRGKTLRYSLKCCCCLKM